MAQTTDNIDDLRFEDAIEQAIQAGVASVRTVLPGRVLSYDHSEQRATAQPTIRSSYVDPDTEERRTYLPEAIENCPVNFPQGGEFSMTWPLKKGDTVELRVASRAMEDWLDGGGTDVRPQSPRRHNINDIIVDPGIRSFANALQDDRIDDVAAVLNGEEIHLGVANPENSNGDATSAARDDRVEAELKSIRSTLNSLINAYNAHDHQKEVAKSPVNESTQDPIGDVAADKVKVK